jgi:hypothetical protein
MGRSATRVSHAARRLSVDVVITRGPHWIKGKKKGIRRTIEILGTSTLVQLHQAISLAFSRPEEKEWKFVIGRGKEFATKQHLHRDLFRMGLAHDATTTSLDDLKLKPGSAFSYTYDFIVENWEHRVSVAKTLPVPNTSLVPHVSKRRGKSPAAKDKPSRQPKRWNGVYDKAKYHLETVEGYGLPAAHAVNHAVYFLRWLMDRELTSASFSDDGSAVLTKYRRGRASLHEVYAWWDGCLAEDMLSDTGNAFARIYFDLSDGGYMADYRKTLQGKRASEYHITYTDAGYRKLAKVIDRRFASWRRRSK